jgi:hypothetical protein
MFQPFFIFIYHQRKTTEIGITIVIVPVPVVAVQAITVKIAKIQATTIRVERQIIVFAVFCSTAL